MLKAVSGYCVGLTIVLSVCRPAAGLEELDLNHWLTAQEPISISKILANISRPGSAPGIVVASPQQAYPNYYYFWVRDGSLAMDTLVTLYKRAANTSERQNFHDQLLAFAHLSRQLQIGVGPEDMGEPKFYVDGRTYDGSWCRPQNDGPALRALTLIHFARSLMGQPEWTSLASFFYDGQLPTRSVIKSDLEYISHRWQDTNCDLWEEVSGDHFYTRMVQRRALIEGADFARTMNDPQAAAWYLSQAKALEPQILNHWNASLGHFVPTRNRTGGLSYKNSELDSSTILALLHGETDDGFLPFTDAKVVSTFQSLTSAFASLYSINRNPASRALGFAIGRYPEDLYAGTSFNGGNPWFLLTAAFARYCYKAAESSFAAGNSSQGNAFFAQGDAFLARVRYHGAADGSFAEQMNRDTGFMTSASDLTWSYVELLQATWERDVAMSSLYLSAVRANDMGHSHSILFSGLL